MKTLFSYVALISMPSTILALDDFTIACGYEISSTYGLPQRLLLYLLFVIGFLAYKKDWLVGASFGTAMLFSSVTSIHQIVIAATDNIEIWDLDSGPALNITSFSILSTSLLVMWSSSFRKATDATRLIVFLWTCVMIAGFITGLRYYDTPVINVTRLEECVKSLPLRQDQDPVLVYNWGRGWYSSINSRLFYRILFPPQILLGTSCAILGDNPWSLVKKWCQSLLWQRIALVLIGVLQIGFVSLVVLDIAMNEYSTWIGWDMAEHPAAVGQWSGLLSTLFTFITAAAAGWFEQKKTKKLLNHCCPHNFV
ncbi:hypothetical protein DFP73DRAFT_620400 [Morchella snyderi]|nr:hypothetical protein DFP73DRAFT_620400 [Morchella snyderi]